MEWVLRQRPHYFWEDLGGQKQLRWTQQKAGKCTKMACEFDSQRSSFHFCPLFFAKTIKDEKCKSQKPNHKPIRYAAYMCIMVYLFHHFSKLFQLFPHQNVPLYVFWKIFACLSFWDHLFSHLDTRLDSWTSEISQAHRYASSGSDAREDRGNGFPVPMVFFPKAGRSVPQINGGGCVCFLAKFSSHHTQDWQQLVRHLCSISALYGGFRWFL